jgi:hypothetical protein
MVPRWLAVFLWRHVNPLGGWLASRGFTKLVVSPTVLQTTESDGQINLRGWWEWA